MLIALSPKRLLGLLGLGSVSAFGRGRSESSLVRAARERDKEAFRQLMLLYAQPLCKFTSRRVPLTDVDDVLQETWVSVWQGLPTFEGDVKFQHWAFSICFRKVQDYWRREYVRHGNSIAGMSERQQAYMPKEFEQVELRESIEPFWKSCPPDQREMLAMYYGDGFTLKEIGEVLGRNLNTVKYQFYRAHEVASEQLPDFGVLENRWRK